MFQTQDQPSNPISDTVFAQALSLYDHRGKLITHDVLACLHESKWRLGQLGWACEQIAETYDEAKTVLAPLYGEHWHDAVCYDHQQHSGYYTALFVVVSDKTGQAVDPDQIRADYDWLFPRRSYLSWYTQRWSNRQPGSKRKRVKKRKPRHAAELRLHGGHDTHQEPLVRPVRAKRRTVLDYLSLCCEYDGGVYRPKAWQQAQSWKRQRRTQYRIPQRQR